MIKKYQLKKTPFIPTEYATLVIPQPNNHSITDDNMYIEIKNDIHNYFSNLPTKNEIKEYNYENTKEKFIVLNELGNMEKKQIAYHFFQLNCKEYTEAVFCIRCSKRHKIWINDILFTVTNLSEQILLVKLNKGSNTIVIETGWARPGDNIFLRLSPYRLSWVGSDIPPFYIEPT